MANPLLNMMKPNLNNLMQGLAGTNPQQMLLSMLQSKNPQGYQQVMQLMNSGKDPQEILNQMTSQMTPEQINQVKTMASQFGIKL